jgi:hypothetical protein
MTDPAFETLWKHVLDNWDDDKAHGVFLEHCQRTDQLLEAAVRYRGMAGDHQRGSSASKRLQAITLLAMSRLDAQRTLDRPARRGTGKLVLIVLFVAGTVALLALLTARR